MVHYSTEDFISLVDALLLKLEGAYQYWKRIKPNEKFPLSNKNEARMKSVKALQMRWDYQARHREHPDHEQKVESDVRALCDWTFRLYTEMGKPLSIEKWEAVQEHIPRCFRKSKNEAQRKMKLLAERSRKIEASDFSKRSELFG